MQLVCFFYPKTSCDIKKVEVARSIKLTKDTIIPASWIVPRKRLEYFQDDLYPLTRSPEAIMSADEFFAGERKKESQFVSLKPDGMIELSKAPTEELTERQKQYQKRLLEEEKAQEAKPKGATGHTSATEVREHFSKIAQALPSKNRWDAVQDNSQVDVDTDEWA